MLALGTAHTLGAWEGGIWRNILENLRPFIRTVKHLIPIHTIVVCNLLPSHKNTGLSLSSRFCNILCNIVCRIRRDVCFRNRTECYWPDGRNSGMHRAAPSVPCLLWGKVCCCCDTRNVSVPMLSKTNYHYKHLDLHANIQHNSNRDGRESYIWKQQPQNKASRASKMYTSPRHTYLKEMPIRYQQQSSHQV